MERKANQESFILKPQSSLSTLGVLKETIKIIVKNRKPVGLILLFVFFTTSHLELAIRRSQENIPRNLSVTLSNMKCMGKAVLRDIRELLAVKLLELICSCYIFLFFAIATISSSYEAYTEEVLSLKGMLLKTNRSWKRPFITSCYMSLISLGLYLVHINLGIIPKVAGILGITSSYQFYTIELIVTWIASAYLGALWLMISIVVSVLEDGINGLKVIDRAGELMKGKRIQASLMIILYYIALIVVEKTFAVLAIGFEEWARMDIEIPFMVGFICLLKLFVFVFYTVIYHEGKVTRKEEGILFVPIAADGTLQRQ